MSTYNATGAPAGWNWCLSYLATAGILIGFDASGHVAEETKHASVTAARGIFWSTVVSGIGGLATIILFLFCAVSSAPPHNDYPTIKYLHDQPDNDTLMSFGSPQPFVPLYAVVLGKGGHVFMNVICIVALWLVSSPSNSSFTHVYTILNHLTEHSDRHRRRLPPSLRRRSRRCPPILQLGLQSPQRPAPQCRHRSLGCLSTHQLHAPTLRCCFHISSLSRRRSQRRRIRSHLSRPTPLHPETLPKARVESRTPKQAVPVHRCLLERLGGSCAILTLRIPRHGC